MFVNARARATDRHSLSRADEGHDAALPFNQIADPGWVHDDDGLSRDA